MNIYLVTSEDLNDLARVRDETDLLWRGRTSDIEAHKHRIDEILDNMRKHPYALAYDGETPWT